MEACGVYLWNYDVNVGTLEERINIRHMLINDPSPFSSTMFAPGVQFAMAEFHSDSKILSEFVVSVFVLGYVLGTQSCLVSVPPRALGLSDLVKDVV